MQSSGDPFAWMDISLDRAGEDIRVSARGSRGEQTAPRPLGADFTVPRLEQFTASVRNAAARGVPLSARILAEARAIERALMGSDIALLLARLREAAKRPLLVRVSASDKALQAVPWEALCKPDEAMGFWASAPDLLPVRGVTTTEPWQPREIRDAVRVLAIAPTKSQGLAVLRSALDERIASGEIAWLDPIEGSAACVTVLFARLRRGPIPHVLHFLGHGGLDGGEPALRLADDDDGDETWLRVELLAQQLKAGFQGAHRLIVLEACEGARPGAFASAAELLARAGADAVVAHLWPIKANVARTFSQQLYRALAGQGQAQGDIALALNEARRAVLGAFEGSAETFSPVVYLRGPEGVLFDFKRRKVAPPAPQPSSASGIDPALRRLLGRPYSLLLGDHWKEEPASLRGFHHKLHKELAKTSPTVSAELSMSALAQRFAIHRGADKLGAEFQRAFRSGTAAPPLVRSVARLLCPGVHTTLLRHPWLEEAVAELQPGRTLYVIQPDEESTLVLRREADGGWEELEAPPAAIDPAKDIILLRLYRGYTPEFIFTRPLLSEDDYLLGLRELEDTMPPDLANVILSTLSYRPALIMGLSIHAWPHRMLLHRVYPRGVPRGSLAVLDPADAEEPHWEKGAGLPGKGEGVAVFASSAEDLAAALETEGSP
jgi:hypothetical protein